MDYGMDKTLILLKTAQTAMYSTRGNMLTNTDNMFHVTTGICELENNTGML